MLQSRNPADVSPRSELRSSSAFVARPRAGRKSRKAARLAAVSIIGFWLVLIESGVRPVGVLDQKHHGADDLSGQIDGKPRPPRIAASAPKPAKANATKKGDGERGANHGAASIVLS